MTTSLKQNLLSKNSMISLVAGFSITLASLYTVNANAAPIYKVVDERTGQVTFTDNPQAYEQQAGKQISQTSVTTGNSSTNQSNPTNNNQSANTQSSKPLTIFQETPPTMSTTAKRAPINYRLTMTEPSVERAYQRPAQSIVVNVQTQPALQKGDYLQITLDGQLIGQGLSTFVPTVDILPGKHSVEAVIKNEAGQTLQQLQRTIFVIQTTNILRQKQQLAEQLQAYQRLPWQQKLLLKLRQKDNINVSGNNNSDGKKTSN